MHPSFQTSFPKIVPEQSFLIMVFLDLKTIKGTDSQQKRLFLFWIFRELNGSFIGRFYTGEGEPVAVLMILAEFNDEKNCLASWCKRLGHLKVFLGYFQSSSLNPFLGNLTALGSCLCRVVTSLWLLLWMLDQWGTAVPSYSETNAKCKMWIEIQI